MRDAEDAISLALAWHLLVVRNLQVESVPLDSCAILLRMHYECVVCLARIIAHNYVLHEFSVTAFVYRHTTALQLREIASLLQ